MDVHNEALYRVLIITPEHRMTKRLWLNHGQTPPPEAVQGRYNSFYAPYIVPERRKVIGPYGTLAVAKGQAKRQAYTVPAPDAWNAHRTDDHNQFDNRVDDIVIIQKTDAEWVDL